MRLEKNHCGPSVLQPAIDRWGWARTSAACHTALGFPPELVTTFNEVRRIVAALATGGA